MKQRHFRWVDQVRLRWIATAVLIVCALPPTAVGAERMVLGEAFLSGG